MGDISEEIEFCALSEITRNGYVVRWIEAWKDELIAFQDGAGLKVMSSVCPHFGGPLLWNRSSRQLVCEWHAYRFCPATGKCLTGIALQVRDYSARVLLKAPGPSEVVMIRLS